MAGTRQSRFTRHSIALGIALMLAAPFGLAHFSSGQIDTQEKPAEQDQAEREKQERERAREALRNRLERVRAEQARLEATLAAIDAGQPLDQLNIPGPRDGADPQRERPAPPPPPEDRPGLNNGNGEFTDQEILAFISEVYPEWAQQMEMLRERNPEALDRMLADRRPRLIELMRERRDQPAVFEVRQRIARSEMRLRRAAWSFARADDPAQRTEAEQRLDEMLHEQFDLRIELAQAELAEAERETARIRAEIETTLARKLDMIAERKADLIRAIRERRSRDSQRESPREGRPGNRPGGPNA